MSNSPLIGPDSALRYTVVEVRNIFEPQSLTPESRYWLPGITLARIAASTTIPGPVWVSRNGGDPEPGHNHVCPGDVIYIWPEIHPPLAPIGAYLASLTAMQAIQLAITVVSVVMTVVSVIQGLMQSTPDANKAGAKESPTYGFDDINPSREGFPVPIYYGHTILTPPKLGEYLTTDGESNQTYHGLFAVGQGIADGLIEAADIVINDEPLTSYKNYSISSTIGDNSPPVDSFPNFTKIHQYRSFQRPLGASTVHLEAMLHFNGDNESVTIVDETDNHAWIANGAAALTITDPFAGSACLECPGSGDTVCTGSPIHDWKSSATIEMRVKIPAVADHGFMGGEYYIGTTLTGWWGLSYLSGRLIFEVIGRKYDPEGGVYSFEPLCSVDAEISITADTWTHLCVQMSGMSRRQLYEKNVRLYMDGALVASGVREYESTDLGINSHTCIGSARHLESGVPVAYEAACFFDELRISTGDCIYDLDGFTPPESEIGSTELDASETIQTLNAVDGAKVVLGALRGLYRMGDSGELKNFPVEFELAYRRYGTAPWTASTVTLRDASLQAVRREFELSFPARGIYEIRIERTTPADDATNTQNETSWIGIDEILDEHLLYPNCQMLELNILADERLQGNVPTVRVVGRRTSITVPTYDGAATQVVDATNPGWVAYDILTSDLYGAAVSPATRIDSFSHAEWVEWCGGMVAGYRRAQFNGVFDTDGNIQQALRCVYDVGRVCEITLGQKIGWAIEKPGQAKHNFTIGNTDPASHSLQFMPRTERVDVVIIEYTDRDKRWKRKSVSIPSSTFNSLTVPARTQKIFLRGCNNEEQARREGILKMQMTERLNRAVSFRAGLEAVTCLPGHLANFQHGGNGLFFGGRVRSISGTSITLDRVISLDAATFSGNARIWIRTCEDVLLSADILGPWDTGTNTFTLSSALAGVNADYPDSMDPYMLGRYTNEVYTYRILDVSPPGQDLKSQIQAIEYNETVYYHPDYESGLVAI